MTMNTNILQDLLPLDPPATRGAAAAQRLREAIVSGKLPPGTMLKDVEVAAHMGISPVPLREAMVQLASEGLVEISPNRWKRVAPLDYDAMVELLEVQQRIWEIGYEWAAARLDAAAIALLASIIESHKGAIACEDLNAAVEAALSFHLVFMRATENRELLRISIDRLPLIRWFVLLAAPGIISADGLKLHQGIHNALQEGDVAECLSLFHKTGSRFLDAARGAHARHNGKQHD